MRQIKFRSWDEHLKKFHYWDSETLAYDSIFWDMAKNENMPVEQFTGIFDKKGKEVYEGDKVKAASHNAIGYVTGNVYYYHGCACFVVGINISLQSDYDMVFYEIYELEVIGNIHENKELL